MAKLVIQWSVEADLAGARGVMIVCIVIPFFGRTDIPVCPTNSRSVNSDLQRGGAHRQGADVRLARIRGVQRVGEIGR